MANGSLLSGLSNLGGLLLSNGISLGLGSLSDALNIGGLAVSSMGVPLGYL